MTCPKPRVGISVFALAPLVLGGSLCLLTVGGCGAPEEGSVKISKDAKDSIADPKIPGSDTPDPVDVGAAKSGAAPKSIKQKGAQ